MLSFGIARQMTSPEAYIQYCPDVFQDDGEVTDYSTNEFLRAFMAEFRAYIGMVLTVLPGHRSRVTTLQASLLAKMPAGGNDDDDRQSELTPGDREVSPLGQN